VARARLAPSLKQLRTEVDVAWPMRSKRSDGWIGDAAHLARTSDHNPDADGIVHALDITAEGINVRRLVVDCTHTTRPSGTSSQEGGSTAGPTTS